jgi:disulfide bond formation protein DsbB
MIQKLFKAAFVCPHFIFMILGGLSVIALTAALISQYVFDMHPCYLCLWQRVPYAVVIMLSVMGVIATKQVGVKYGAFNILLCGVAFLINSGIAFFHVGVEQQWWSSGCSVPNLSGMSPEEMMAAIQSAPAVSCQDIPFELFGISMAGYNVMLCLALGVYSLIAAKTVMDHKNSNP